jgi:hypothetical protein
MLRLYCEFSEVGSPILIHLPKSILIFHSREQSSRFPKGNPSLFPFAQSSER